MRFLWSGGAAALALLLTLCQANDDAIPLEPTPSDLQVLTLTATSDVSFTSVTICFDRSCPPKEQIELMIIEDTIYTASASDTEDHTGEACCSDHVYQIAISLLDTVTMALEINTTESIDRQFLNFTHKENGELPICTNAKYLSDYKTLQVTCTNAGSLTTNQELVLNNCEEWDYLVLSEGAKESFPNYFLMKDKEPNNDKVSICKVVTNSFPESTQETLKICIEVGIINTVKRAKEITVQSETFDYDTKTLTIAATLPTGGKNYELVSRNGDNVALPTDTSENTFDQYNTNNPINYLMVATDDPQISNSFKIPGYHLSYSTLSTDAIEVTWNNLGANPYLISCRVPENTNVEVTVYCNPVDVSCFGYIILPENITQCTLSLETTNNGRVQTITTDYTQPSEKDKTPEAHVPSGLAWHQVFPRDEIEI